MYLADEVPQREQTSVDGSFVHRRPIRHNIYTEREERVTSC